ncbi:MAG: response regulator [Acidimicrobiales bacterium]
MTAPPIRVVVADDHPIVREGMRLLFQSRPDVEIVGEAGTGGDAVALAAATVPDVVIMDVHMPGLNGIEATRRVVAENPSVGVLVVTMYDDDETVFAAMRAGARGYLLKGAEQDEIVAAVTAVSRGDALFGAPVAARILSYFAQPLPGWKSAFPELTERERQVLDLVASGRNNPAIGQALGMSTKTVANNVSNILTKLHAADRAEAIIRARDAGLGR